MPSRRESLETTALVTAATASQPQRLVVTDQQTRDDAQASGRWLAAASPAEVRR